MSILESSPPGRVLSGLLGLTTLLAFVVQSGLLYTWRRTFGALLEWLAALSLHVGRFHIGGHPFSFLHTIDAHIVSTLQAGIAGSERAMVYTLTKAAEPFVLLVGAVLAIGLGLYELARALPHLLHKHASTHVVPPINRELGRLRNRERELEHRLGRLEHARRGVGAAAGAQDFERLSRGIDRLQREITRVQRREHALEQTRTGRIARPVTRPIGRSAEWTKVLTRPAAVALTVSALGSLGFHFLRCSSWQRAARRVSCGWGSLLEDFLRGAVDVLLLRDLCRVVSVISTIAVRFEPELLRLVDEIEGFICGGAAAAPTGIVAGDFRRVASLPTGIVPADLEPPARSTIAA